MTYTQPEILRGLADVEADVATFFNSLTPEHFVLRVGDAWTPAEHLHHVGTAVNAVARGFAMNRLVLRLRFGRADHPSRSYAEVREAYRALLAGGAKATAEFTPPAEHLSGSEIEQRRTAYLSRWRHVNDKLRRGVAKWSENDLDRITLPHPILGKLTAREMLLFTLYHNEHHVAGAKRRLPPQ